MTALIYYKSGLLVMWRITPKPSEVWEITGFGVGATRTCLALGWLLFCRTNLLQDSQNMDKMTALIYYKSGLLVTLWIMPKPSKLWEISGFKLGTTRTCLAPDWLPFCRLLCSE